MCINIVILYIYIYIYSIYNIFIYIAYFPFPDVPKEFPTEIPGDSRGSKDASRAFGVGAEEYPGGWEMDFHGISMGFPWDFYGK